MTFDVLCVTLFKRLVDLERIARDDAARAQRSIAEAQAELTALIGVGHSETKIKVAALEAAVVQLDQRLEKTGAAAAAAAAAVEAGDVKKQQQQDASPAPVSQADLSRAFSVADRALQTSNGLEARVTKLEGLGGGGGRADSKGLDIRIKGVEEGVKLVKQQVTHDVPTRPPPPPSHPLSPYPSSPPPPPRPLPPLSTAWSRACASRSSRQR